MWDSTVPRRRRYTVLRPATLLAPPHPRLEGRKEEAMSERAYVGGCFCGAIEARIGGTPAPTGFGHCVSGRQWSGSPVNAFPLCQPIAVTIVRGARLIG